MSKNKHLNLDDKCKIQLMLDNKESFPRLLLHWKKIQPLFQRRFETISSTVKWALIILPITPAPNVFPVRNPISAQNAMLPESIPYAGAVPYAMLSARISKKKPADVF